MNIKNFKTEKTYRLCMDIENPKPDKRVTVDWRKRVIIPAGKLFFFRARNPKVRFGYDRLEPMDGYATKSLTLDDPLLLAMAPYLDLIEDTLQTVLKRHNITEADVLRFLVKTSHTSIGFIDGFGPDIVKMLDTEPVLRVKE